MTPPPPNTEPDPSVATVDEPAAGDGPAALRPASDTAADDGTAGTGGTADDDTAGDPVVRRAPFADNPHVGARGQRTQQRILDAALQVFGEVGFHQSGIARITKVAGCSRASFYQYFSSKEELFRQLSGQVARQLRASSEALNPITPDLDGWATIRGWVARHGEIYDRYEPVFKAFPAAADADDTIAPRAVRVHDRNVALLRSKLTTTSLPPRQLDPVIQLLMACLTRTHDTARTLAAANPESYDRERINDALADVIHRSFFGLQSAVNVHPAADRSAPELPFGPILSKVFQQAAEEERDDLTAAGRRTLESLMEAGRDVFVARGYHNTRVDDIVTEAGVSHGAFYRYFKSKDDLAHALAGRAMRTVSQVLVDIPDTRENGGNLSRPALRRWLRSYNATHAAETAMIRVWVDAAVLDPTLGPESVPLMDWGRRRMVRFLEPRDFGDVDAEAVVMLELLSAFGTQARPPETIEAAAHIIEHGLLGR